MGRRRRRRRRRGRERKTIEDARSRSRARGHRRRLRKSTPRHLTRHISARRVCVFSSDPLRDLADLGRASPAVVVKSARGWWAGRLCEDGGAGGDGAGGAHCDGESGAMGGHDRVARGCLLDAAPAREEALQRCLPRGRLPVAPLALPSRQRGGGPEEPGPGGAVPGGGGRWVRARGMAPTRRLQARDMPRGAREPRNPARDRRDGRRHPTQSPRVSRAAPRAEISRARAPSRRSDRSHRIRGFPSNRPRPSTPSWKSPEDLDPPRPTPTTDPRNHSAEPPGGRRLPAPRVARSTLTSSNPLAHAPHPSHSSIPRSLAGPVSLGVAQRDARVQLGHERRHVGFLAVFHPPPPRIGPRFPRRRRGDRPRIRPRQLAPRRRHGGSRRVHQDDPPRSA